MGLSNHAVVTKALIARARRRHGLTLFDLMEMTPSEFAAYEQDWKEEVEMMQACDNSRMASLMALIANCHRDPKKSKAYKPEDFFRIGPAKEESHGADAETIKAKFAAFAAAHNQQLAARAGGRA